MDLCGDDDDAPPPKRKRDALRELVQEQQLSACREVKTEKGEALENFAEAEETLGYQVRTTDCLQGKIDELVALCGESRRLSGLAQRRRPRRLATGRPPRGRGRADAVDRKVASIKYRTNR